MNRDLTFEDELLCFPSAEASTKMDIQAIIRHYDSDPDTNPWVHGTAPKQEQFEVVPFDPTWSDTFGHVAADIRTALGPLVLALEHVGSTSVPGLEAKPVIDIDLTVSDPADEASYIPALETLGYDHTIREPNWHEHRCLQLRLPKVNLHVFGPNCPEVIRHRLFRDWLCEHPDDCRQYEQAKRQAATGAKNVMEYNARKQDVIRAIYAKIFRAKGYL